MGETDINQKVVSFLYEVWEETDEYRTQSAAESSVYDNHVKDIERTIGKRACHDISDHLAYIACDAEYSGFENGFRYGVMFMNGILKGQVGGVHNETD